MRGRIQPRPAESLYPLRDMAVTCLVVVAALWCVAAKASSPTGQARLVHVNTYHFDPLLGMPELPPGLRHDRLPPDVRTAWIVQFHTRITGGMRHELEALGVTVIGYLPDDSYLVEADERQVERSRGLSTVRWVGLYEPAFKLSPDLDLAFDQVINRQAEKLRGPGAPRGGAWSPVDTSRSVPVRVRALGRGREDEVGRFMEDNGATEVATPGKGRGSLGGNVPRALLRRLAHHPGVLWIERELPAFVANDRAAWTVQSNDPATRARSVHDRGLTGEGQTITIADTGIDYNHVAFEDGVPPGVNHRKLTAYYNVYPTGSSKRGDCHEDPAPDDGDPNNPPPIQHGTHVAGTVAGDELPYELFDGDGIYNPDSVETVTPHDGMAFRGDIQVQDIAWFSVGIQPPLNKQDLLRPAVDPNSRALDPNDPSCFPVVPHASPSFIHSNSWGEFTVPSYTEDSVEIDDFVWDPVWKVSEPNDHRNHDLLVLFAAGNTGPDPYSVGPMAVPKNILTVGASGNAEESNDFATDPTTGTRLFSSRGPACDGRIKPDIMAPGRSLWSAMGCFTWPEPPDPNEPTCEGNPDPNCIIEGFPGSVGPEPATMLSGCDEYRRLSGTSMATPVVAGGAALVRQYFMEGYYPSGAPDPNEGFTPSAALLKATLINGAVEMTGSGAYENGEPFYPNNQQGWGRLHLDESLYFQGEEQHLEVHDERTGVTADQTMTYPFEVTSACGPLEATLVWTDAPAMPTPCDPNDVTNLTAPTLVNDLDLIVRSPLGVVYRGNNYQDANPHESMPNPPGGIVDRRNNVEGVLVISNLTTGTWSVEVSGYNIPLGYNNPADPNQDLQPFALVINCADADDDDDGDPDVTDCAPLDPSRSSSTPEICDGLNQNCDGVADEGFADTDGDAQADCVDPDDDNDGDPDTTDCAPLDPAISHLAIEALPSAGGVFGSCHDGMDNDCDGTVDLDCAQDVDAGGQTVSAGTLISGSLADISATSSPSPVTYEVFTEAGSGSKKRLIAVWNFTTTGSGSSPYELAVEAFRASGSNDDFKFSYLSRTSTAPCDPNEAGWSTAVLTVSQTIDPDSVQTLPTGALPTGKVCVRVVDTRTTQDNQPDTLTLDRLYLFPVKPPCPDADADGYAATCTGCTNAFCPVLDCNDGEPLASPGLAEGPPSCASCSDGVDNDCSGQADALDTAACGPRPDAVALTDYQTGPGVIQSGSVVSTRVSDSSFEVLRETFSQGASKLKHTWSFNVPAACSHRLRFEGFRPANTEGDNFQFSWASDPSSDANFTLIPGALIDKPFYPIGGLYASFTTPGAPTTIYIRVMDTNQTSGSALDTVHIDMLKVETP